MKKTLLLCMLLGWAFITSCDNDLEVPEEFNSTVLNRQELIALFQNGIMPPNAMVRKFNKTVAGIEMNGIVIDDQFIDSKRLSEWVRTSIQSFDRSSVNSTNIHKVTTGKKEKRVLSVNIITKGTKGLTDKEKNAVIRALQRYNALKLRDISFEWILDFDPTNGLTKPDEISENELQGLSELEIKSLFETYTQDAETFNIAAKTNRKDIRILSDSLDMGMALSRIPYKGNPGNLIIIDADAKNLTPDELVVLMQHEIGHTLGLVHSDFKTRKSCSFENLNSSKLEKMYKAIGVDINASGNEINALMSTCFSSNDTFEKVDINDLIKIYGVKNKN